MRGHAGALLVSRPPLSGPSSPGFQTPQQSSSPSAVATGAKLVSPPLFQSMYSRSRYSDSGIGSARSRSATNPRSLSAETRGCGVSSGMSVDQGGVLNQWSVTALREVEGGGALLGSTESQKEPKVPNRILSSCTHPGP